MALNQSINTPKTDENMNNKLLIKSGTQTHQVLIAAILFLQKDGNYMNYHLEKGKIMARESVANALAVLPNTFIQVHKSYIVNTKAINSFTNDTITIGTNRIPIGNQYKNQLLDYLK